MEGKERGEKLAGKVSCFLFSFVVIIPVIIAIAEYKSSEVGGAGVFVIGVVSANNVFITNVVGKVHAALHLIPVIIVIVILLPLLNLRIVTIIKSRS